MFVEAFASLVNIRMTEYVLTQGKQEEIKWDQPIKSDQRGAILYIWLCYAVADLIQRHYGSSELIGNSQVQRLCRGFWAQESPPPVEDEGL